MTDQTLSDIKVLAARLVKRKEAETPGRNAETYAYHVQVILDMIAELGLPTDVRLWNEQTAVQYLSQLRAKAKRATRQKRRCK